MREQLDTIVRYLGSRHRDIFKLGMVSKALRRELQEVGQVDFTLLRDKHSDKVERRRLSEAVRRVYLARRFLHVGDIGRTASRRKPNTYARIAADCGVTQQELKDRVDDIDANSDSDATDPTAISDDSDPPPVPRKRPPYLPPQMPDFSSARRTQCRPPPPDNQTTSSDDSGESAWRFRPRRPPPRRRR